MNIKKSDKILNEETKSVSDVTDKKCSCDGQCVECTCNKDTSDSKDDSPEGSDKEFVNNVTKNPDVPYLNLPWGFLSMLSENDLVASLGIQLQNFIWTLNSKYLLQMANIVMSSIDHDWSDMITILEDNYNLSNCLSCKDGLKLSQCVCSIIDKLMHLDDDLYTMLVRIITCYVVVTERPQNIDMCTFNSEEFK